MVSSIGGSLPASFYNAVSNNLSGAGAASAASMVAADAAKKAATDPAAFVQSLVGTDDSSATTNTVQQLLGLGNSSSDDTSGGLSSLVGLNQKLSSNVLSLLQDVSSGSELLGSGDGGITGFLSNAIAQKAYSSVVAAADRASQMKQYEAVQQAAAQTVSSSVAAASGESYASKQSGTSLTV